MAAKNRALEMMEVATPWQVAKRQAYFNDKAEHTNKANLLRWESFHEQVRKDFKAGYHRDHELEGELQALTDKPEYKERNLQFRFSNMKLRQHHLLPPTGHLARVRPIERERFEARYAEGLKPLTRKADPVDFEDINYITDSFRTKVYRKRDQSLVPERSSGMIGWKASQYTYDKHETQFNIKPLIKTEKWPAEAIS